MEILTMAKSKKQSVKTALTKAKIDKTNNNIGKINFTDMLDNLKSFVASLKLTYAITNNSIRWTNGVKAKSPSRGDKTCFEINRGGVAGIANWSLLTVKGTPLPASIKPLVKPYKLGLTKEQALAYKFKGNPDDGIAFYTIINPGIETHKKIIKALN